MGGAYTPSPANGGLSSKGENAERKIIDWRSGDTLYREIWPAENDKQGENFAELLPTYIWVFSLRVLVSLTFKPVKNAWVMKEKSS